MSIRGFIFCDFPSSVPALKGWWVLPLDGAVFISFFDVRYLFSLLLGFVLCSAAISLEMILRFISLSWNSAFSLSRYCLPTVSSGSDYFSRHPFISVSMEFEIGDEYHICRKEIWGSIHHPNGRGRRQQLSKEVGSWDRQFCCCRISLLIKRILNLIRFL